MKTLRSFVALLTLAAATAAPACPFCSAEQRTLTEEINDSSVVLLGKLAAPSEAAKRLAAADVPAGFIDPETGAATFKVERVLKGQPLVEGVQEVQAIYFGESDPDQVFFIRGVAEPPDWAIPLPLSPVAAEYVPKLLDLPAEGVERLAFFQDYLEHSDPLLAQDAYDEFAAASYKEIEELAPRMDRQQLRDWIEDVGVSPSRRRLFLTMLGACGEPADLARLEQMLTSDSRVLGPAIDAGATAAMLTGGAPVVAMSGEMARFAERQRKLGLDALIACYMTLAGKHGDAPQALDLIDERYLQDKDADYSHVYAALQALRFLGEEHRDLVPLDRVLASARLLLDNPEFADQVIPDLARWEDWSVLDRLTDMYRSTFDENNPDAPVKYVREPIVTYLDVAATQPGEVAERANAALEAIEPLDPKAVERARSLRAFGFLAQARAKADPPATDGLPAEDPAPDALAAVDEDPAGDIAIDPPADVAADLAAESDPEPTIEAPPAPTTTQAVPAQAETTAPTAASDAHAIAKPSVVDSPPPPSRVLLVGAPLAAATLMVGLFWLILRSGVA